jgi:hypothetical protein
MRRLLPDRELFYDLFFLIRTRAAADLHRILVRNLKPDSFSSDTLKATQSYAAVRLFA